MHTIYNGACGAHLITDRAYGQGELICAISQYQVVSEPTYQTIQIGQNMHLEELGIVAYMNHSCKPNTIIDTTTLTIRATRDIQAGEDIYLLLPIHGVGNGPSLRLHLWRSRLCSFGGWRPLFVG